jgi:predicted RNA-binding protein YlxR (DUF448 family)
VSATPPSGQPRDPQRRCIVTGEIRDRGALLRFVVGPDGAIVPDIEARLPGRGLWLTPRRDIVERAVAKRIFARAARRSVSASPELADRIESLLARRCYDAIGLARRAGLAVAGFERVGDAVRRGQVGLLLVALGRGVPSARVLTAAELGGAFGRERTVHGAIADGPLCRRLLLDLTRLVGLRAGAAVDLRADPGVVNGMDFAPAGPAPLDGGTEAHD